MKRSRYAGTIAVIQLGTVIKSLIFILVLLLFIFSLSGLLTSIKPKYRITSDSVNSAAIQFPGELLYALLSRENHYFAQSLPKKNEAPSLAGQLFKLSTNISFDDPRSLLGRELPGFFAYDNEILLAGEGTNYTNMPYESAPPETNGKEADVHNVENIKEEPKEENPPSPPLSTNGKKVVHIYNTHSRESYLPYLKGVKNPDSAYSSKINVTRLSEKLQSSLEKKGIGTSVSTTDVMGILDKKNKKFWQAYDESRPIVQEAMAKNRDINYLIDIHRDASRKNLTTVSIKGKSYAKLAFVVGGDNANFEKNYALAEKIHKALDQKYPKLSRGVFKKQGSGNNGKYNQDLSGNALLIEAGGVDNTFEELYASLDAFADAFSGIYWNANEVSSPGSKKEAQ
ncbi:stage II sporulation protein P [Peribacillus deserti]|uniref:Stage II sporulation protein P n=1 Tax=Peribacillus deserti TaxID=673318 RepID=A0ABS2QFS1_9BACI|nr:stage II sporulation protein P [Peribacillus deserti]MBM7691825.1 stage II sporulation protein P [Peribacillus deserti]